MSLRQPLDKRAWLARNLTQPLHRAVVVDNADSNLREGYVEPDENAHGGLLVSWLNGPTVGASGPDPITPADVSRSLVRGERPPWRGSREIEGRSTRAGCLVSGGWNACTELGSVNGTALENGLKAARGGDHRSFRRVSRAPLRRA